MAIALLKYANRAEVARALTANGYEVKRAAVNRWAAGSEMPGIAARMILELFGHAPDTAKEPQPEWAKALRNDVLEAIRAAGLTAEQREAVGVIDDTTTPTPEDAADPDGAGAPAAAHE